ncbi:HTH_Tnp_Tc3_2 domain-containing protein [Trichonephila clavipes]|nr:HTH_Tnp_Tc3_2 domain-containing protein [Trichonephila clavipes]
MEEMEATEAIEFEHHELTSFAGVEPRLNMHPSQGSFLSNFSVTSCVISYSRFARILVYVLVLITCLPLGFGVTFMGIFLIDENYNAAVVSFFTDDFMRGRIIGKIEEGRKITDVVREFDIAHSVVSRLWKSFKTTGMCSRRHGGDRVRSTTPAEDRDIVLSAKRNRCTTAQQVANQFLAASGKQISRKTVARRLRGGGLYARRPVVCVPLTRQHRTARLQWCREYHNWTEQDWACVLFSDESRFSLSPDCRRQLIWRESGTAYRPENIQEKDRYPTCSIMV